MSSPDPKWVRRELYESVTLLAAQAREQLDHLARGACPLPVDDLALTFHDFTILLPQLNPPPALMDRIRDLDKQLEIMSGSHNTHLWEPEALERPEWVKVRDLAREAREALLQWEI